MAKKLVPIFGILLLVSLFIVIQADNPDDKKHDLVHYKYEEALEKAKQDSLHVIILFETSWCTWCKKMDKTTFKDEKVLDLMNNNFVVAKVDGDKRRDLTKSYKVRGYPSYWFLKSDGSRIAPVSGYWPAEDFYWLLNYVKGDVYEKEQWQDYYNRVKKEQG